MPNLRFPGFEGDWDEKKLGEIGEFAGGGTPNSNNEKYWQGDIPWISSSDITLNNIFEIKKTRFITQEAIKNSSTKLCEFPSIHIVSRVGVGKVALSFENVCTSQDFANITEIKSDCYFLAHLLSFLMQKEAMNVQGTSIKGILTADLKSKKIFLPTIAEQKKISSLLNKLDSKIHTQRKTIENLESLIKIISKGLFYEKSTSFVSVNLGEICSIKKGAQINSSELDKSGDFYVMNGGISPSGWYHLYNSEANTISISEGGNSCGYVQYNKVAFWSGGHCYTLLNIDTKVNNKFLYHFLKFKESKIMALRIGSGLPNIQKKNLGKLEVKVPNLPTQEKIVEILDSYLEKIEIEKEILKLLELQKKYLLKNLFV